jgi:hypothetical protein
MSTQQRETASLSHTGLYDDGDECRKLKERIAQVQNNVRCVQHVASVIAPFLLSAIVGVAFGVLLRENLPYNWSARVFIVLCLFGLASLICMVGFMALLTFYHRKLNRLRKECIQAARKTSGVVLG